MSVSQAPGFAYGLETPQPIEPCQNYFQLIGWAHLPGHSHSVKVRVLIGDQAIEPQQTIQRPDVAACYPEDPGAHQSGFKIIGYLPFGFYTARLEASADNAETWHLLRPLAIPVRSHPLRGSVETEGPLAQPKRVEGWLFHPEFSTEEIVLQFGNVEVSCEAGLARPDVAERFPTYPAAAMSGFITTENLPIGSGRAKVRLRTHCGRVFFMDTDLMVDIRTGWSAKPPPSSPVRDLATTPWQRPPSPRADTVGRTKLPFGSRNILFVLYGDFSANSAFHVAALANELIALGYDCVVAVPENKATLGSLPAARFLAINFDEVSSLGAYYKDGRGPCVLHAWTPREIVREFCDEVMAEYDTRLLVHLEDNEWDILEQHTGCARTELTKMSEDESDTSISPQLMHPRSGPAFMANAAGITVIVESLKAHAPAGHPAHVIWPAADPTCFKPIPRDNDMRRRLGIANETTVLFYHGNVHVANDAEMHSLYQAVGLLNQEGVRTLLIRTGRDYPGFTGGDNADIRPHLLHLGHIERPRHLPRLMAMADYFVQPGLPGSFNDYRFPSKLPEFFALGRPVILPATNLGKHVNHGEHAWVLPVADARSIADAVKHLSKQPELTARLSAGACQFSDRHFSWPTSAARLVEFYRGLTPLGGG